MRRAFKATAGALGVVAMLAGGCGGGGDSGPNPSPLHETLAQRHRDEIDLLHAATPYIASPAADTSDAFECRG